MMAHCRPALARFGLSALYGAAGLAHLIQPQPFVRIVPGFVPWPEAVVFLTGLAELAGAVVLHMLRFQRLAGLMLALYALAVWPANVNHALDGIEIGFLPTSWWYHGPRLALQPVLIWLALLAGGWLPRQRDDRALEPFQRERVHPPVHQLADQAGGVGVAPAHLRDRVQPD
jgi:uncharacterized membrane protein